jgi:two-component system OmpR family response regulator
LKVLLIEDDSVTAEYLTGALGHAGHRADHAGDGLRGLNLAMTGTYDALIVDRMLPSLDGLSVVETLRKAGRHTPVLILSALDAVDERVRGLRAGGDDYLTKPFEFTELLARLEVIVHRRGGSTGPATVLRAGDLELDLLSRRVRRGNRDIELKTREFQILEVLLRNAGRVVTRAMLLESVWDFHFDPKTNVIEVHVSRLRQKIDRGEETPLIQTVRGAGYKLIDPQDQRMTPASRGSNT